MSDNETSILCAAEIIGNSRYLCVSTGAGVSAESGVPTFRGAGGKWNTIDPEDVATYEAFSRDPEFVWSFYNDRRVNGASCRPNPAHIAIAQLEKRFGDNFTLITQNVDNLHREAGSERILEIHGNIWRVRCTCCNIEYEERTNPLPARPYCKTCGEGAWIRPAVVWFGETLDFDLLYRANKALESCDALLIVGTSGYVYPAAEFIVIAKRSGARVIEINVEETPNAGFVDAKVLGKAGEMLPRILSRITGEG
ncbi:MAG: NAD-dependent deacylase [Planctomycetes bacterium]|nr:NAD-dependent deacylase [Planctomycetota bacterium]